jgi:hypothetical protein
MNRSGTIALVASAALTVAGVAVVSSVAAVACDVPVSVSGLAPAEGFEAGGTVVEITGTNFVTCGIDKVSFGGTVGTDLTLDGQERLTVVAPAGTGVVAPVLGFGSQWANTNREFRYVASPRLDRLRPPSGVATGGTRVLIDGEHFAPAGSTTTVRFGDLESTPEDGLTDRRLWVPSPEPGDTGVVDVRIAVTLASGEVGLSDPAPFEYVPAPTVDPFAPDADTGPAEGGNVVTITGTGFRRGVTVLFGPSDGSAAPADGEPRFGANRGAPVVEYVDAGTLRVLAPSGPPGVVNVVVVNADGQFGVLADGYTYEGAAPAISSVSPGSGPSLGGTEVTIAGTGFLAGATVSFGEGDDRVEAAVTAVASTSISAVVPAHPADPVTVRVTNPDGGTAVLASGFTYLASPPPTISATLAITPSSGPSLGGTSVVIDGNGFASGAVVTFGLGPNAVVAGAAVIDATRIIVVTPAFPAGVADVRVKNPDGQSSEPSTFTFDASPSPTLSTIVPATGPTAGGTKITIGGTNFADGAVVTLRGIELLAETAPSLEPGIPGESFQALVRSSTQIVGITPNQAAGPATLVVRNPDGAQAVLDDAFTYTGTPPPAIGSIEPEVGTSLGGLAVDIIGTNFAEGSTVTFGLASCALDQQCRDVAAPSVRWINATQLEAVTPAGLFGFVNVTVVGPDGVSTTLPYGFDFGQGAPSPQVLSVTPDNGPSGTEITVNGSGFGSRSGGTGGADARVEVGNRPLLEAAVTSGTTISGKVPVRSGGTVMLTVVNPDRQGAIREDAFSYPIDTTPPSTTATGSVTVPAVGAYIFGTTSWARGPVNVMLVSADGPGGSGVAEIAYSATGAQIINPTTIPTATAEININAQGVTTLRYAATDIAGNTEDERTAVVAVDSLAPAISADSDYRQGSRTNQDVMVTFTCVDTGSRGSGANALTVASASTIDTTPTQTAGTPPTLTRAVTFTEAGLDQSVIATCTDVAGNSSTRTFGNVNITRDVVEVGAAAHTADGRPYVSGTWTNQDVVVTYTCNLVGGVRIKTLSGPDQFTGPITDGSATGTCTDTAGNSGSMAFGGIRIDRTRPVVTATAKIADGSPYVAGRWTTGPVTVTFTCTDDGDDQSGVVDVSDPVVISANGRVSGVIGNCTDRAGNRADPAVFLGSILIDVTPPTCDVIVNPNPVGPANGRLVPVVATVRVTDTLSGPERFELVSVTSNRPASIASDVVGFTPGTESTTGSVRTTRDNLYTFTYVGFDRAGNISDPCTRQLRVG